MKSHLMINWLIFIICLIGSIWQLTSIIQLYFSYQTVINVKLDKSEKIEVPAASVCLELYYSLNYRIVPIVK